jgi:DNA-binding protein WhiA
MSYTHKVKEEVLEKAPVSDKEKLFEIYGVLDSKKAISSKGIVLNLENEHIVDRVYKYIKDLSDLKIFTKVSISKKPGEHKVYTIQIPIQKGYRDFVDSMTSIPLSKILKSSERKKGYVRGVFLSSGYIKDPENEYALDFFIDNKQCASKVFEIFSIDDKRVFITKKRSKSLVYFRNSEDIMDILVLIGAIQNFFRYEEVIMVKDLKNKTIREMNWEVANETKTLNTGQKQIKMINYIGKHLGLNNLTPVLEEVAMLRLLNPESSLSELADMVGITKSGIRNRFRRIEKLYNELLEKKQTEEEN